jgi:hypothetical protein
MLLAESIPGLLKRLQIRAQKRTHSILMSEFQKWHLTDACVSGGATKRCRLSWMTNRAYAFEPKCRGGGGEGGGVAESQPMSTAVQCTWSPNNLWRSNSKFVYLFLRAS